MFEINEHRANVYGETGKKRKRGRERMGGEKKIHYVHAHKSFKM